MDDFEKLDMFELKASYDTLVKEVTELHGQLTAKGIKVTDLNAVTKVLEEAFHYHQEKFKVLIRKQKKFSSKKIEEITNSFQESMASRSQEGALYSVEETLKTQGLKPSHYVGQCFITDKIWYLEDTGSSSYSVMTMGGGWAENIIAGRTHLLVDKGKEIAKKVTYNSSELRETLEKVRESYDENYALILSPMTAPWEISSELFLNEHQVASAGEPSRTGRSGKLGKLDIYYARFVKRGELLVVPKMAFGWVVNEKLRSPKITMIEEGAEEAIQLREKTPDIDLGVKALVYAREEGIMTYKEGMASPVLYLVAGDDPSSMETGEE
jgi:hypothetical protein